MCNYNGFHSRNQISQPTTTFGAPTDPGSAAFAVNGHKNSAVHSGRLFELLRGFLQVASVIVDLHSTPRQRPSGATLDRIRPSITIPLGVEPFCVPPPVIPVAVTA